jgi:hypothetical protein
MSPLQQHHLILLERALTDHLVPHLPPLLDTTRPPEEQRRKNLSRAFSAFALHRICDIPPTEAAKAVVDDFDDYGIDAVYYHAKTETLYLVQSKLKASEQFSQEEALAFCQGIRKLIRQDFRGFNKNIQDRLVEIEDALDNCSHIQLVVAHTGAGISNHAKKAVRDLLQDDGHGEERFESSVLDYDAARVVTDLQQTKAYQCVDTDIYLYNWESVSEPRATYFGLVQLEDLVKLHQKYGKALYEKNIRTFLGHKTDVNASIRQTLSDKPKDFLYLNNGIAALCQQIEPKGQSQGNRKKLRIQGFSVINGAQTIASAARFLEDNHGADITDARVSLTLIQAAADGEFGKSVTRARNHQNPVSLSNFVALDDEQERLRRELAHLGIHYAYKAEVSDNKVDPQRIAVDQAAQALALFHSDPRFIVWLKKEPARLLDMNTDQYQELFSTKLTAVQLVNAVRFLRYIQFRMANEAMAASGPERLIYKHGNHALGWVLAKRITKEWQGANLLSESKLQSSLGMAFDQLRQTIWTETGKRMTIKGPLALFKNMTDVIPLLEAVLIQDFGLGADPAVIHKRKQQKTGQPYPKELFDYVISRAPQIGNLS